MQVRDHPGKIVAAIFGLLVIGGFAFLLVFGWASDPWHSQSRGPGWECDNLGKGAVMCARDVPKAWQKPRNSK
jgi:hypothetical protein